MPVDTHYDGLPQDGAAVSTAAVVAHQGLQSQGKGMETLWCSASKITLFKQFFKEPFDVLQAK